MRQITFSEYIKKTYDNELFNEAAKYVRRHRSEVAALSKKIDNPYSVELEDIKILYIYYYDAPGMDVKFDVVIQANVSLSKSSSRYGTEEDLVAPWITITCTGTIADTLKNFRIISVHDYRKHDKENGHLSETLVPFLYKTHYDQEAQEFLEYCGLDKHLRNPAPLDVTKVINALDLKYRELTLTQDKSILGRIYMYDCTETIFNWNTLEEETVEVAAGTLVVDPIAEQEFTEGARNNTIIHECFHWYKHRKAFALQKMCNPTITSIEYTRAFRPVDKSSDVSWMERQARAMAPRILMPSAAMLVKIRSLYQELTNVYKENSNAEIVQVVISELARFFKVSQISVQIRLIEMGYTNAIGINNYVDGHYVPPHSVSDRSAIGINQTFTLSDFEALYQSVADPRLREALPTGKYAFVENHYVLNHPKYIMRNLYGRTVLTSYARTHMEECALIFDRIPKDEREYDPDAILYCVLNRDSRFGIDFAYKLAYDLDSITPAEYKEYAEYKEEIQKTIDNMGHTFPGALKAAQDFSGLTQDDIGHNSHINRSTVSDYMRGKDTRITKPTLVKLCVGMNLPWRITEEVFNRSEYRLSYSEQDCGYRQILQTMSFKTIQECNTFLKNCNLQPLEENPSEEYQDQEKIFK